MISGLIGIFITYWVAILPTIQISRQLRDTKAKLLQVENAPEIIAQFQKQMNSINSKIGENYSQGPEFQKNILDEISKYCEIHSLTLREFPEVHTYQKQDYEFITAYARIEGEFIPLLKLLYELESGRLYGRLISVDFLSTDDFKSKRLRLTMSIYIQTIKQNNNAKSDENI